MSVWKRLRVVLPVLIVFNPNLAATDPMTGAVEIAGLRSVVVRKNSILASGVASFRNYGMITVC